MTVVRDQLFPQNQACDSRAQGFSPPLARQRSSCPPPSPNLVRTHPIVEYYQALRDSAPCLSRAATLPKGTKLGLGKRRAPGNTIILSQPYRRRVSTDRLNREGSQLGCVCVFIKLHITAQSGPVILAILCHSHRSSQGGINDTCQVCMCVCVVVCVFFPFILDIKFVGHTSRGHTGGRSHRIFHPPSFCGACLNFFREKDSGIPFPRRL